MTVITAQDLADAGQSTLLGVLQRLGGVEIASNGGAGQPSARVHSRRQQRAHARAGRRDARSARRRPGTTAFENIPLDQIDRIEIVAGPLSGLYGSDAIGGVIQIFTKSARGGARLRASSPGYGTLRHGFALARRATVAARTHDFAIAAGYANSDQFDATLPTFRSISSIPIATAIATPTSRAALAYHFGPDVEIGVSGFYSEGTTHFDNGPDTDDQNHAEAVQLCRLPQNQLTPGWQSLLRVGSGTDDSTITGAFPGVTFAPSRTRRPGRTRSTSRGGTRARRRRISAAEGVERRRLYEDVAARSARRSRDSPASMVRTAIQVNVRYDDNSQFGDHVTGSVGYGYRFDDGFRLRASAGKAFHAPTFNDLYYPVFGNPDLKAERSTSVEMAIDYQRGIHQFAFTYFENRISDLIVFDFDTFLPQNLAKAKIRGAELSYQGRLYDALVRAKLTLQDPIDASTGLQLPRRSRQFGSLVVTRPWGAWNGGVEVVGSGARFDSTNEDPSTRLGGYAVVNLFVNRSLAPQWSMELRWNNVLNKEYELVQFYNTPHSNVFLSLKWTPLR